MEWVDGKHMGFRSMAWRAQPVILWILLDYKDLTMLGWMEIEIQPHVEGTGFLTFGSGAFQMFLDDSVVTKDGDPNHIWNATLCPLLGQSRMKAIACCCFFNTRSLQMPTAFGESLQFSCWSFEPVRGQGTESQFGISHTAGCSCPSASQASYVRTLCLSRDFNLQL